jgi:prepilin-type N-terminal cleavage/methylation domain-containing protein
MKHSRSIRRRGLSLTELLIASAIMVLIAGGMGSLAMTVHSANDYSRGRIVCAQHARVALDRIEQAIDRGVASEQFPLCLVVSEQVGSQELPQTLVVWSPITTAANPGGLPRVSELVIFAPDPAQPRHFVEFRAPSDTSAVPVPSNVAAWRTLVEGLKASQTTERIVVTNQLRTAPLSGQWTTSLTASQLRGVVRFRRIVTPSEQEWSQYKANTRDWDELAWPLDSYRATSGTRTVVCQSELQVIAGDMASAESTAVPFFGSALRTYELAR